jgi:DNA-binding response OmpR family regulator
MVKLRILPPGATTAIVPEVAIAADDGAPLLPITADWRLDLAGQRLVGPSGEVLLPALEFRLLLVFRRHPHRVLSREQLLDAAWGRDFAGTDRVVDQAVYWLRRVLEPDPARPRYLCTRRGLGYSYCPPPPSPTS